MNAELTKYLPDYVSLYYVDYRDNLDNQTDLLQECVKSNSLQPIDEVVYDFWDYPEGYYLDEIRKAAAEDGLEELYEENEDEIREWLWDNDESDPVKELLQNTDKVTCYYDFDVIINGDSDKMSVYKIRRLLGIKKGTKADALIQDVVLNAVYGGYLRIYFESDVRDLLTGNGYDENVREFKTLNINGPVAVAIINPINGSGYMEEEVEVHKSFPFERKNLCISRAQRFGWCMEEIFGIYDVGNSNVTLSCA